MPAAAVIPAPIVYIKVVAVKKLVVECRVLNAEMSFFVRRHLFFWRVRFFFINAFLFFIKHNWYIGNFYCE